MISAGGRVASKTTKSSRASAADTPATPEKPSKKIKTKLTRKQLNYYRNLLLLKRAEIVGDLSAMEAEALRSNAGSISHMPIHMADLGTDTFDQDFMLGLAETEREMIRDIDRALQRIQDRTYGICEATGQPITKARLEAKPWATYSIAAKRQLEHGFPSG